MSKKESATRNRKSKRASQQSRRKPRKKAITKTPRQIAFPLLVEAQEMLVTYQPHWLEGNNAHFEFMSPYEPPRRIILSETGYFSHFAPMDAVKTFKSPQEYARIFALSVLNSGRKPAQGQLSLF